MSNARVWRGYGALCWGSRTRSLKGGEFDEDGHVIVVLVRLDALPASCTRRKIRITVTQVEKRRYGLDSGHIGRLYAP